MQHWPGYTLLRCSQSLSLEYLNRWLEDVNQGEDLTYISEVLSGPTTTGALKWLEHSDLILKWLQEQRPQGQKMAQVAAAGLAALFIAAVPAQAADTESLKKKM